MTMAEAIDAFVADGASVALGTGLEPLIPFAAGHELIRQRRQDLELVGPISDSLFDELIGAGCVRRITAAWVGNVSEGLGHCYRRAAEQGVWKRDHVLDNAYAAESRTREGYEAWLKRWVLDVPDRQAYMTMVDVDSIRITGNRPSEPVNFADE